MLVRRCLAALVTLGALASLAVGGSACSSDADALAADDGGDATAESQISASASCSKHVFVHVANFTDASPLNDAHGPVASNGCWGSDMAKHFGHEWGSCKGAMNKGAVHPGTWVDGWGDDTNWGASGSQKWFYNETSFAHEPSDDDRIANCFDAFADHWSTRPAKGYAYMMYRGQAGWKAASDAHVALDFAELYGPGTWFPYWEQWKANPVGRPMVNIADGKDGKTAHDVVKAVCEHVESSTFIGIYVGSNSGGMHYDSAAWAGVVRALDECTGGKSAGGGSGGSGGGGGGSGGGGSVGADAGSPPAPPPATDAGAATSDAASAPSTTCSEYTKTTGQISGTGTVCCNTGDTLVSVSDCASGANHSATASSASCAVAAEGAANGGTACAQITCRTCR